MDEDSLLEYAVINEKRTDIDLMKHGVTLGIIAL